MRLKGIVVKEVAPVDSSCLQRSLDHTHFPAHCPVEKCSQGTKATTTETTKGDQLLNVDEHRYVSVNLSKCSLFIIIMIMVANMLLVHGYYTDSRKFLAQYLRALSWERGKL